MGLFLSNGTRVTKANVSREAEADPLQVIGTDLYLRESYNSPYEQKNPAGDKLVLFCRAGKVMRKSEIDLLFPAPTVTSISPDTGDIAGDTTVTIKGKNLDGVIQVKFGATAGTGLVVKSPTELTVKTPVGTAGAKAVEVTDDGGTATVANGFTYTDDNE